MLYLIWSLPMLALAALMLSGRVTVSMAALAGLAVAALVAFAAAPQAFGLPELGQALLRGGWIGFTIAPYILGGLLFWQTAMDGRKPAESAVAEAACAAYVSDSLAKRRRIFFACFLIGPFAESATGFGVGMVGTIALLSRLGIAPRHLMVFGLLSQTYIPWGAMGSGTLLAAAYARLPAPLLSLYVILPAALLMLVWLPLYWRTIRACGLAAVPGESLREAGWIAASLVLLALASKYLGPETALLSAFGPLIVLRHLVDERPPMRNFLQTARRSLPYLVLILALLVTRLAHGLKESLGALVYVAPFADLPAWMPVMHAGSWLIGGAFLTAVLTGRTGSMPALLASTWNTARHAVFTVFVFSMMAEVLSMAAISKALAQGMFSWLGAGALVVSPLISAAFGILTNSSNAPNSLFMPSLVALTSQAGLSVPMTAALQQAAGACLSIFSPVRMTIAAGLSQGKGEERQVYARLLPYMGLSFLLIGLSALLLVAAG